MIDIESLVYNTVKTEVNNELSDMKLHWSAVPVLESSKFPFVELWESDNQVDTSRSDSGAIERYANITYTVEIYCNSASKRADCKKIAKAVDKALSGLCFSRMSLQSVGNLNDNTLYRMVGRYVAKVDENGYLYQRR